MAMSADMNPSRRENIRGKPSSTGGRRSLRPGRLRAQATPSEPRPPGARLWGKSLSGKGDRPMNKFVLAVAAVSMLGLGACGTSRSDRALSGAGLGAAAGAGVSALTGGNLAGGAVIGGAAGAL